MTETALFMDNFYILDDGRVRQFLIIGEEDALLIDTGFEDSHVYEAVRKITDLPVKVILTHGDGDHAGGLKDFGECYLHKGDWHLIQDGVQLQPLSEGDAFECGGYRFETVEIPGHTYGSVAFFDREKRLLLPGDSVQKAGPIYMFGEHRNLDLYIRSQKKLLALANQVDTIIPCHHEYPIGPEYIGRNLEDAEALKNGELKGEKHPVMPCYSCKGKWTEFYYKKNKEKDLILVSMLYQVTDLVRTIKPDLEGKTVTYIPTAGIVEEIDGMVEEETKTLESLGMDVDVLDVSTASFEMIENSLAKNDVIFVGGGNTFFLLQELRRSGADRVLLREIGKGKIYIGESAGAVIACPDIEYCAGMDSPDLAPELTDYTGLGLVDFYIVPHIGNPQMGEAAEKAVEEYSGRMNIKAITDEQIILVEGESVKVLKQE